MDKNIWLGDWQILKGKIKQKWGELTDDDLTQVNGKRDELLGVLQKKCGYLKEKALHQLTEWEKSLTSNDKD